MRSLLPLLLVLPLAACQGDAPSDETEPAVPTMSAPADTPRVLNPFVTAAPEAGTAGVFLTLVGGTEADTLVAARFVGAERVEVHESYEADGLRGMREVEGGIPVPAGGTVDLRPGGYHIMLIRLAQALTEGDTLDMELELAGEGTLPVRVPVQSLSAMPTTN